MYLKLFRVFVIPFIDQTLQSGDAGHGCINIHRRGKYRSEPQESRILTQST